MLVLEFAIKYPDEAVVCLGIMIFIALLIYIDKKIPSR